MCVCATTPLARGTAAPLLYWPGHVKQGQARGGSPNPGITYFAPRKEAASWWPRSPQPCLASLCPPHSYLPVSPAGKIDKQWGREQLVQSLKVCFRFLHLRMEVRTPRPCPEHLNQHFWGWRPEIGILARLPRDSKIKAGIPKSRQEWVIHVG